MSHIRTVSHRYLANILTNKKAGIIMIHLYSGDGKGKTSIAVGMSIRMAGAGGHVIFAQFMKGNESSELNILRSLDNVEVIKAERDFPFYGNMTDKDKVDITKCHNDILKEIAERINNYSCDEDLPKLLIVLDEITYPCNWHLIDDSLLQDILNNLPDNIELVMTGRDPLDYMKDCADYYSEVCMHKHPYQKGARERLGIEM